ncbi:forkhead box protein H1-like [Gastrophryne carolinensis]
MDDQRPGTPQPQRSSKKVKKKNYQRHAKPPYSYLAMIALVIRGSPDRMLKLSQILKHIEILFPFFKGDYIGWKDSVRHNLSSNDCFRKVLKDPGKPQAKGNYWTVDVSRIPREAMKLQNTVTARDGGNLFVADLAPFILHDYKFSAGDVYQPMPRLSPSSGDVYQLEPRLSPSSIPDEPPNKLNSFMIDSLLHNLQVTCPELPDSSRRTAPSPTGNMWPPGARLYGSAFQRSSSPAFCAAQSLYSSSCASLSTISPRSSDEDPERCRNVPGTPPPRSCVSLKRPREDDDVRSVSSCDSEAGRWSPGEPPAKLPFLPSDLPTSYTKCIPPNAVAPPNVLPFYSLPQFGYYSYGSSPYMSPTYWGLVPQPANGRPEPQCPPPADLDSMLRAVPPNKSVFDVLNSHPGDVVHPAFLSQYVAGAGKIA